MSELQDRLQALLAQTYRIDRELGGGGMSRVFVATETELDRQVVIKVLPPDLSAEINTERFRREIRLAARLQHPHIIPLHVAGGRDGLLYYTMPYIAGENLRARLARVGEFPVAEGTRILREVADALSYAHSQGVVHRDIKPENILISGNHALVTDFGVSKALSSATSETPADGPTLTSVGIALGTPAYMAPEQAAADPHVDARADIYALGIVGYEMFTGRTPFAGLDQQQTLSAHITKAPPPIGQLRPQLPPGLATIIMRAIEKRPADRWQSAEEMHDAMEPYVTSSGAAAPVQSAQKLFAWTTPQIAVAAGIVGIIAAGFFASTIAFRSDRHVLAVGDTRQVTNAPGLEVHPAISPDGRMVAYTSGSSAKSQIFLKQLSGGRAIALTDSARFTELPNWKPDGSEILYLSTDDAGVPHTFTVPALGGSSQMVPGLDSLLGCSWSNAGDRIACTNSLTGALVISGPHGENRRVIPETTRGDGAGVPAWSPDDKVIAFAMNSNAYIGGDLIGNLAPSSVWVVRSDGGNPVRITDDTHLNTSPQWTPDGAILFVSDAGGNRDIYMQRLSSKLSADGAAVRLTTGLNAHTISIDRSGRTLAYSVFNTTANIWYTPIPQRSLETQKLTQLTTGSQTIENFVVSPDGKWIAYDSNLNGNQDIFKMPITGGDPQQLTHNGVDNFWPNWSPDGREIAFHTLLKGNRDIYVMDANGGNPTAVVATPREERFPVWSSDGTSLSFVGFTDSIFVVGRNGMKWGPPKLWMRSFIASTSRNGKQVVAFSGPNRLCSDCPAGLYLLSGDLTTRRLLSVPNIAPLIGGPASTFIWSKDSRHAFIALQEKDGTSSIWQLPINGDPEKRVIHLIDAARQFFVGTVDMDLKNFYLGLGDRQSDIWTMALKKP